MTPTTPSITSSRKLTHCQRGHILEGENVFVAGNGDRRCRACYLEKYRETHPNASKDMRPYQKKVVFAPGQRYFYYTILSEGPPKIAASGNSYTQWLCLCDCGEKFYVSSQQITRGVRKSCGCHSRSNRFKKCKSEDVIATIRFNHYKQSAKARKIKWNISLEEFKPLIYLPCHYCEMEPYMVVTSQNHSQKVNGVDRVDNSLGYCVSNCVPCCRFCNCAKGAAPLGEFLAWMSRLVKRGE